MKKLQIRSTGGFFHLQILISYTHRRKYICGLRNYKMNFPLFCKKWKWNLIKVSYNITWITTIRVCVYFFCFLFLSTWYVKVLRMQVWIIPLFLLLRAERWITSRDWPSFPGLRFWIVALFGKTMILSMQVYS